MQQIYPNLPRAGIGRPSLIFAVIAVFMATVSAPAWSAVVTFHESGLESIYGPSNPSGLFTQQVDVRFGNVIEYVAPDLLTINSSDEFNTLRFETFDLPSSTIRLFYVDAINWCGDNGSVAGCANSTTAVVRSSTAASSEFGDELIAHEIGHVLGLSHTSGNNLLNPSVIDGRQSLTSGQITTLLNDHNLLYDMNDNPYIDIAPILVVAAASAVPLPGALLLMLGAVLPLGFARRNR